MTEIEIPNSTVNVRSWTFSGCEKPERVELPKSFKQIDSKAFSDCIELKSIVIPSQVKQIEWAAFSGADEIKQELFSGNDIVIEVSEEKREPGILRWDKGTWGWEDKEKAYSYILWWEGEQGLPIRITQEIRTVEEQDRLYTQRRTTKGKNVDKPHFQLPDWGSTTEQLIKIYGTPDKFEETRNQ